MTTQNERRAGMNLEDLEKLKVELEEMRLSWPFDFPKTIELLGLLLPQLENRGIVIFTLRDESMEQLMP